MPAQTVESELAWGILMSEKWKRCWKAARKGATWTGWSVVAITIAALVLSNPLGVILWGGGTVALLAILNFVHLHDYDGFDVEAYLAAQEKKRESVDDG